MESSINEQEFGLFIKALHFAADKHQDQRRKGADKAPYINHPIAVVDILWQEGGVRDFTTLVAALLHDTVEDTDTTQDEIRQNFSEEVLGLVMECTDDKTLPKAERKRLQVVNAPHKSPRARQIKLADKISNILDITFHPPADWSIQRRREYLDWTEQVVNGLRGQNPALENVYDKALAEGRRALRNTSF